LRDVLGFNKEILALTVNAHQTIRSAHDPFYPLNRRQSRPFQYTNGVENRIGIEDPPAGLMPLAAVQVATPALMLRQAQCSQALLRAVAMRMLSADRQLRLV